MKRMITMAVLALMVSLASAALAQAGSAIPVNADITVSTIWSATNTYNLVGQIYVRPGATLTIEAGTLIRSKAGDPPYWDYGAGAWHAGAVPGDQGSLAVCKGAKIFAMGTKAAPIIFTSDKDAMTSWHLGSNEWGNLTLMGNALVSASMQGPPASHTVVVTPFGTNTALPSGTNYHYMEGLTPTGGSDTTTLFGGPDDNDSSGELHYVSLRYGGKVIGLGNELNGLSMGGIGRGTKVDHIEIMNSVDDAFETWGGTVNYKYMTVWNAGDDSMDFDCGWRGKAQFIFIVQGASIDAPRGSGVSDNGFEMDGAEDSDAQPVTRCTIYNATFVGQPLSGHSITAWRDNCGSQFRNVVFMDGGSDVVGYDYTDGDNGSGYGFNGTMNWAQHWTTPFTTYSTVNAASSPASTAFNYPSVMYSAQSSTGTWNGNICEIVDSVFFRNIGLTSHATVAGDGNPASTTVYTEAMRRGVVQTEDGTTRSVHPINHNVVAQYVPGTDNNMPIKLLQRSSGTTLGGKVVIPVTRIDPRAANDAVTSVATAPADGFYTPAPYRGAFSSTTNWCLGWTAADAYGFYKNADGTPQANPADPTQSPVMFVQGGTVYAASFPTTAGQVYSLESSTDLHNWVPLGTVVGTGSAMSLQDANATDPTKFYRLIAQ